MQINDKCWYKDVCTIDNCNIYCNRYIEMKYLMEHSNLPKAKQSPIKLNIDPDDIDFIKYKQLNEIKNNILDFVEKGNNLVICGSQTGTGKTSWSIKLLHKYFDYVWNGNGLRSRGLFIHVPTLIDRLKDFNDPNLQQFKKDITNTDLVVWDEINVFGNSKFDYNNLLLLLENRLLDDKSNIFTTNLVKESQWLEVLGARLTSRILYNSTIIELQGEDKRGTNI